MFSRLSGRGVFESIVDRIRPPTPVHAHCDIPCGIYDPHVAQLSALTVLRMDQLIGELPKPSASSTPEQMEQYAAKISRYMEVKESHAERVKSELRVIWGDYITPDHIKQWPDLHDKFWKAMKVASKARQGTALADAQDLVKTVQDVAEAFWKTKGVATKRQPSQQKPGGEIVYPAA